MRTSSMYHPRVVVVLILFDPPLCALHRLSHLPFHLLMHSIRVYRLPKTELLKLHLLKRELVNDILYQNLQERSDSRSELTNKHLRVQLLQTQGMPAAVRAVQAAVPVRIPAAVKPRLHHRCRLTKAIRTTQKDRKLLMVVIWSWEGCHGIRAGSSSTMTVM